MLHTRRLRLAFATLATLLFAAACSSSGDSGDTNGAGASSGAGAGASTGAGAASGTGTTSTSTASSMSSSASTGSGGGAGGGAPSAVCDAPITLVDVSSPTTVVGSGTAASCTEDALSAAVAKGGVVTFDCGASPATISITKQIELPIDKDTTIDGGGVITLDGGMSTRVLDFNSPNYRATKTTVTLQRLTIAHAKATGTPIPNAPPPCSQGFEIDGGGAGIFVRDGILHVLDCTFDDDHAAPLGPDVGGGAIYANGSLGVVVVGSKFTNNSGSDSGAIGMLNSDLTLANDVFAKNQATGNGENYIDMTCTVNGGESGDGGNGGAVGIDGGSDGTVNICGCVFSQNSAGALAGAIGRTPDGAMQTTNIDRSTFDGNTSVKGGGALYMHNSNLVITASTFSNNSAPGAGAIQADGTIVSFTNDTFANNSATNGLGGAMSLFGNSGTIQSCTFASNHADAGSGLFGAAIAGGTTLTINDTIFANNSSMDCGAPMTCQDGSSDGSADLQWPQNHIVCMSPDPACASGTTFADPMLGMLADNGGPTKTIAPSASGPAAGAGKSCPPTDQRGNARKSDGCTIGAYELP